MADPYNWERHGSETISPSNPVARKPGELQVRKLELQVPKASCLQPATSNEPTSNYPGVLRYPGNAMANGQSIGIRGFL